MTPFHFQAVAGLAAVTIPCTLEATGLPCSTVGPQEALPCQACHGTGRRPLLPLLRRLCPCLDTWEAEVHGCTPCVHHGHTTNCDNCHGRDWAPVEPHLETLLVAIEDIFEARYDSCTWCFWVPLIHVNCYNVDPWVAAVEAIRGWVAYLEAQSPQRR